MTTIRSLTKEDIVSSHIIFSFLYAVFSLRSVKVDTTGVKNLETLQELEILFLTFDEIASLEHCCNLKKLTRNDFSYYIDIQLNKIW